MGAPLRASTEPVEHREDWKETGLSGAEFFKVTDTKAFLSSYSWMSCIWSEWSYLTIHGSVV